jgi:penicillin-binding protein 1C
MRQFMVRCRGLLNRRWLRLAALLLLLAVGALVWFVHTTFAGLPDPADLAAGGQMPSVRIESRDGQLLYEAIDAESGRQAVLPLDKIPTALQQATIATEDRHFYQNEGVDLLGIARALWINVRGGEVIAGGSTITQQVTRNLLLTEEIEQRTVRRKLRETVLAWRISRSYEKEEILALYLNHSYYGAMAYGVEAAAQTYFGKPAAELTLAESALIAGLPQAPGAYNPFLDPEAAEARQAVVLGLMLKDGFITQEAHDLALRQPLTYAAAPYPVHAPHFVMMVKQQVDALFTPAEIKGYGGLTVRTTLDFNWQARAEAIITEQLGRLNRPPQGTGHNVHNGALVAIDPHSGAIRALVGNHDYFDAADAGAVNMVLSPRQPGSAIKPLIYAAAMTPEVAGNGLWTAATMIPDVRTVFPTSEEHPYVPVNFSREESGPVLVREALGSSLNIPAVAALQNIGLEAGLDFTTRMGIHDLGDPGEYGLSFALGGGSLSLLDLTAAYGVFANSGARVEPVFIEEILAADGTAVYTAEPPAPRRVLDERVAWLISDILSDNQARIPSFGPNSVLRIDRTAAVKTGTTNNFHDNWTVGYTPELVVGVWVGNANNEAMIDVTGVSGAGPIWHQAIRAFLAGEPDSPFVRPPGLVRVEVCSLSGLLPTEDCPYRRWEWFLAGTQPVAADTYFRRVVIDRRTGKLAAKGTDPAYTETALALDLPPEFHLWAREEGLPLLVDLEGESAAATTDGMEAAADAGPRIAYPDPNAVFYLAAALPPEAQRILIKVVGGENYGQLTLWLDGRPLTTFTQPPYDFWWQLEPGEHTISVTALAPDGSAVSGPNVLFMVHPAVEVSLLNQSKLAMLMRHSYADEANGLVGFAG